MERLLKRIAALSAIVMVAFAPRAFAGDTDRPNSIYTMMLLLNASPTYLGTITMTVAGTAKTSAGTAVPFTVTGGKVVKAFCDGAAYICEGTTCSATITNSGLGGNYSDGPATQVFVILKKATTALSINSAATPSCAFFTLE